MRKPYRHLDQPVPSLPRPSSRPTEERAAKAEAVVAPVMNGRLQPWWRIDNRLDALFDAGAIGPEAYNRACRLRTDYERIGHFGNSPIASLGMAGREALADAMHRQGPADGRLDAVQRIRAVRARLGARDFALAYAVAVEDEAWTELGCRLGCLGETAKRRAIRALNKLSEVRRDER